MINSIQNRCHAHQEAKAVSAQKKERIDRFMLNLQKEKKARYKTTKHLRKQVSVRKDDKTRKISETTKKADRVGKTVQTAQSIGKTGRQVAKKLDACVADTEAYHITGEVQKDLKAGTRLYVLGVEIAHIKVLKRELAVMEEVLEELKQLGNQEHDDQDKVKLQITVMEQMIKAQKKKIDTSMKKLAYKCIETGFSTSEFVLDEVLEHVHHLSQMDIDILKGTNSGLGLVCDALYVGLKISEIRSQRKRLKKLRIMQKETLEEGQKETLEEGAAFKAAVKAAVIGATIRELEKKKRTIQVTTAKRSLRFTCKLGEKATQFFQTATMVKTMHIGQRVLMGLSKAASAFSLASAAVGFAFDGYSLYKHKRNFEKLRQDAIHLSQEAEEQTDEALKAILGAKAHRMKRTKRNMKADFLTKITSMLSSTLSLITATEAILIIAGVAIGGAAAAAFAATGVGAAVLGGIVIGLLVGQWLYKNRFLLSYYKKVWSIPLRRTLNKIRIKRREKANDLNKEIQLRKLRQRNEELKEKKDKAGRLRQYRKLKRKMKGWTINDFEKLADAVHGKLAEDDGAEEIRNLLASYSYLPVEEVNLDHVLEWVLSSNKRAKCKIGAGPENCV